MIKQKAINPLSTKESANGSSPSPEELARTRATAAAKLRRSKTCLVPIQPHGSKKPFFCVHPLAGVVFPYYELAFLLGEEQPFFGIQSLGLAANSKPITSIPEMATCYIKAVRTVQQEGPYAIGGWSFGAIIAFEMAQQLKQAGESVLLVSLDGTACHGSQLMNTWEMLKFLFTSGVLDIWPYVFDYFNLTTFAAQKRKQMAEGGESQQLKLQTPSRTLEIAKAVTQKMENVEFRQGVIGRLFPIIWTNIKAYIRYKPQVYPDRMTLLRSDGSCRTYHRHPTLGWANLVQEGVEIHEIPGHHLNILRQPHVKVLAKTLKACLEQNYKEVKSSH